VVSRPSFEQLGIAHQSLAFAIVAMRPQQLGEAQLSRTTPHPFHHAPAPGAVAAATEPPD